MSIADDITGVFNQVSDTLGNVSADVQTSTASLSGIQGDFQKLFGDKTKGTPNVIPASPSSKLIVIGLVLLGIALFLKLAKVR